MTVNVSLTVHERLTSLSSAYRIMGSELASVRRTRVPNPETSFMRLWLAFFVISTGVIEAQTQTNPSIAVSDYTNYNVGDVVRIRLQTAHGARLSIRYAGETKPIATAGPISGSGYAPVWRIPSDTRTGRYEVDVTEAGGNVVSDATSFAVHRQLAKIISVELDKTFYTSGDSVNPTIVIRNLSDRMLQNLQVEFEAYTYPWIAPAADEPPIWKYIVARSLSLGPGEEKTFHVQKAAVVQAEKEPVGIYYSVVIRDTHRQDRIYDLAFALPAFTRPPNTPLPKQYPFLYLYWHLADLPKSEAYRHFYPPEFVSDVIRFDTSHTMFAAGVLPEVSFRVDSRTPIPANAQLHARVLDAVGRELEKRTLEGPIPGSHSISLQSRSPGLYTIHVSLEDADGTPFAQNRLELAINDLPKSILVFCAHQDDDTSHPGIIRAAAENHIPIHFVYFTSGDSGGCDRFYMHSCDAAWALDFGEVRMDESRASLGHMGVPPGNLSFLGLPDGGLEEIWYHHPNLSDPYLSVLLASEHSPFRESAIPNLPYSRDAAVSAAKGFIKRFKPDLILTGHPDERHVDHRTGNWIVVKAMQELLQEGSLSRDTKLVVDVVYKAVPGRHAPYHYEKQKLFVSGEAAKIGQEATWYYQSQDGNHLQADIIDFDKLPREEPYPHYQIVDWYAHAGWNEKPPSK